MAKKIQKKKREKKETKIKNRSLTQLRFHTRGLSETRVGSHPRGKGRRTTLGDALL